MDYDEIRKMPKFDVPKNYNVDSYLDETVFENAKKIYGDIDSQIQKRLNYELKIIEEAKAGGYLLFISDCVRFAREKGFPVSIPGTAGDSLVVYCLGITEFDPLTFFSVFERFINPKRNHINAITLEMAPKHCNIVRDYISDKSGADSIDELPLLSTYIEETMNNIQQIIELVNKNNPGLNLNFFKLPIIDEKSFKLISEGEVHGAFLLDEGNIPKILKKVKPKNLNDLMHTIVLHRPVPLELGMMEKFIKRKSGEEEITYPHPELENVLKDTYGLWLYDEQIIHIFDIIANLGLQDAECLQWYIRRRKTDKLKEYREKFVEKELFDMIEPYARFSLPRAHLTEWTRLSSRLAYLKAHYPEEFKDVTEE